MTAHHQSRTNHFNLTNHITSVFNFYHYEIKDKFSDNPLWFKEYFHKDTYECLVEIHFEKEQGVLTCAFDEEKKCKTANFFMKDSSGITDYIEYINKQYPYNYLDSKWILANCSMSIKRTKEFTYFMFFR